MLTQAPVLSSDRWRIIETVFDGYVINCSEIPTKVAWNKSDLGSFFTFSPLIAVCDANFYFKFVTIFKMKIVRDLNSPSQTVNAEITHWLNGASSFTKVVNVAAFPFWLAVWQLLLLDILYVKQQRLNQRLQAPRDSNIRDKSFFFDVIRQINDLVTELQWICVYKGDSKSRKYIWGWFWQSKNEKRTSSEWILAPVHSLIYLISISPTLFCSMSYLSNWTRLSFLFFQMSVSLLDILCMTFDPVCSDMCLMDNGHIDCRERI